MNFIGKKKEEVNKAQGEMEELSRVTQEGIKNADGNAIAQIDEEFLANIKFQEEELLKLVPEFNLPAEIEKNPMFAVMLSFNEPLQKVFEYFNPEFVYREMEKEILERIKSRNLRPSHVEQRGKTGNFDVGSLNEKDMAEIDKRVRRGERIEL